MLHPNEKDKNILNNMEISKQDMKLIETFQWVKIEIQKQFTLRGEHQGYGGIYLYMHPHMGRHLDLPCVFL